MGETVLKVKVPPVRIENSLSPLYRGTDFSTLAETFKTVWGGGRSNQTIRGKVGHPQEFSHVFAIGWNSHGCLTALQPDCCSRCLFSAQCWERRTALRTPAWPITVPVNRSVGNSSWKQQRKTIRGVP